MYDISGNKSAKFQIKIPNGCWENKQRKTLGGYFILLHPVEMGMKVTETETERTEVKYSFLKEPRKTTTPFLYKLDKNPNRREPEQWRFFPISNFRVIFVTWIYVKICQLSCWRVYGSISATIWSLFRSWVETPKFRKANVTLTGRSAKHLP